jgi:hypothetical protein
MRTKIMFVVASLAAMSQLGLAEEERSVESPETFHAVCDKAMPDLLQGKTPEALRKVASDEIIDKIRSEVLTKIEPFRGNFGAPVDWIYTGVRKRGDMLRQFVYLCRYDQCVMVWRLTAEEAKGRWYLGSYQCDLNLLGILSQAPASAPDNDSPYARLGDKIADSLAHCRSEAVETLKANCVQHDSASFESYRSGAEQAMASIIVDGGVVKCGAVETRSVGGVLALRSYLVRCNRGAFGLAFVFYRPGDDWKVFALRFAPISNADDAFAGAPLELSPPLAAPHTARASKAAGSDNVMPRPR